MLVATVRQHCNLSHCMMKSHLSLPLCLKHWFSWNQEKTAWPKHRRQLRGFLKRVTTVVLLLMLVLNTKILQKSKFVLERIRLREHGPQLISAAMRMYSYRRLKSMTQQDLCLSMLQWTRIINVLKCRMLSKHQITAVWLPSWKHVIPSPLMLAETMSIWSL